MPPRASWAVDGDSFHPKRSPEGGCSGSEVRNAKESSPGRAYSPRMPEPRSAPSELRPRVPFFAPKPRRAEQTRRRWRRRYAPGTSLRATRHTRPKGDTGRFHEREGPLPRLRQRAEATAGLRTTMASTTAQPRMGPRGDLETGRQTKMLTPPIGRKGKRRARKSRRAPPTL